MNSVSVSRSLNSVCRRWSLQSNMVYVYESACLTHKFRLTAFDAGLPVVKLSILKQNKCIIDYVWSRSKEVDKWAVNSIPDCTPWLILAPRSLLLSKGLSTNPRDTTLGRSTDSFPIANTNFSPSARLERLICLCSWSFISFNVLIKLTGLK